MRATDFLKEFVDKSHGDDYEPPKGNFKEFMQIITTELKKFKFKTRKLPDQKNAFACIRTRDENTLDAILFALDHEGVVLVKQGSIEEGQPYFDDNFIYRVSATMSGAVYCLTKIEEDYNLL
jgi:hypothetical protein